MALYCHTMQFVKADLNFRSVVLSRFENGHLHCKDGAVNLIIIGEKVKD